MSVDKLAEQHRQEDDALRAQHEDGQISDGEYQDRAIALGRTYARAMRAALESPEPEPEPPPARLQRFLGLFRRK